ncbi:hypothetical protein PsYK624_060110 [Phanerochaete sordida]|uniref:BTB domain-containing protein n=1 Tax=Phanerochaete sordida TaxID=48140 RepID=A0A9P3G9L2_9APHY|nr:hypothetical protein PsYK624_060110 [Phanerochaete sordida]
MPASTRSRTSTDDADTPNKRRKVEPEGDEVALSDVELGERSKDLWFEDGGVILAAQGMSFRVHKGLLALRSDVFKALLDDAALRERPEAVEGCPVVRVEDRGKDLHDLLHIIYNGANSDWHSSSRPPIKYSDFRRVVDIALKYDIKDILAEAKYRLSQVFPTDNVDDWVYNLQPLGDETPLVLVFGHCIDIVRISRLLGMHSILPLVFYTCCNIIPFEDIARGVESEGIPGRLTLSPEDLFSCLKGRDQLLRHETRIMRAFQELAAHSHARSDKCTTQAKCRKALQLLDLSAIDGGLYNEPDPIDHMDSWLDEQEAMPNARPCQHCDEMLRQLMNERRKETWCKLGEIFGVPEWPAGQKDVAEAPAKDAPVAA